MVWGCGSARGDARKLVVGLGNPGKKYARSRHNLGFEVIGRVARQYGGQRVRSRFQGELTEVTIHHRPVVLLCPHTYMNLSGASVQAAVDFYKLPLAELLVVCDDFSLPLGKLRCRAQGSSGGQKGLDDVIRRLGTNQVARLRVGIGQPPPDWDVTDFVLSRFDPDQVEQVEQAIGRAAGAVSDWTAYGIEYCMNTYNGG